MAKIKLYWSRLKYDIDQETYKAAKVQITGDENAELRNEAQTGMDTFDAHYCKRKIEEGILNLQHSMHKFFVSVTRDEDDKQTEDEEQTEVASVETSEASNKIDLDNTTWTLEFDFDARRAVNESGLAVAIHRYIVLNILQEWTKIAMPAMESNYLQRLLAEENRIKSIAYRKEAPILAD